MLIPECGWLTAEIPDGLQGVMQHDHIIGHTNGDGHKLVAIDRL